MKKILLMAAATAAVLSSCSKNEVVSTNLDNKAIGFDTYVSTSSKAAITDADVINTSGEKMGVFAYSSDITGDNEGTANFMNNVEVTRGESVWTYSPIKYWPTTGNSLDFFAYYPYQSTGIAASSGYPAVTFEQEDDLAKMIDFVYATEANQKYDSNTTANGTINFAYKHALSRIAFSARPKDGLATTDASNSTFITVTAVKVTPNTTTADDDNENVISNGVLTFSETAATIAVANGSNATATTHSAAWSLGLATAAGVDLWDVTTPSSTTVHYNTSNSSSASTNFQLSGTSDYIFIIPQTFATSDYISVEVTYTTTTYESDNSTTVVTGNKKTAQLPAMTFAQGTAYNFPLIVGPEAIVFGDVSISADWGTEDVQAAL